MLGVRTLIFITLYVLFSTMSTAWAKENAEWEDSGFPSIFAQTITTTPYGLIAGEFDTRVWLYPYNGVYISKDWGNSWVKAGLDQRGVKDTAYCDGKIYAATYYNHESLSGVFVSNTKGLGWQQKGPKIPTSKVSCYNNVVVMGAFAHGLWVSEDGGESWTQRIGDGWGGPEIKAVGVYMHENPNNGNQHPTILVATSSETYRSEDLGATWSEIASLKGISVQSFTFNNKIVVATGLSGLWTSVNNGISWTRSPSFGDVRSSAVAIYKNRIFASRFDQSSSFYTIVYSDDFGQNWHETDLQNPGIYPISKISTAYADPPQIFATIYNRGIYKTHVSFKKESPAPFLSIPWTTSKPNELSDKISSFFDHQYPLLGYSLYPEPKNFSTTTLNYLGEEQPIPQFYYSSHSGYDFRLGYGTNVYAAASGKAEYYFCPDCGNTVKVNHENGHQSIYMHLQDTGLITNRAGISVDVDENTIIGKVGLTGKTTGPHLHFEVSKGKFPDGRTDPFGWTPEDVNDPWSEHTWIDQLGIHNGAESYNLWKDIKPNSGIQINSEISSAVGPLGNFQIKFPRTPFLETDPYVLFIKHAPLLLSTALTYAYNTSLILEAYNSLGNKIEQLQSPIQLIYKIDVANLPNVAIQSLKIYYWQESSKNWEPVESFFDPVTSTLKASVSHFSRFAVFGMPIDSTPPITQIQVLGGKSGDWFYEPPAISLQPSDNENTEVEDIFYTINNLASWQQYISPIQISQNGVVEFFYKSQDIYGNLEDTNSYILQINTHNFSTKKIKIKNAEFSTLSTQ